MSLIRWLRNERRAGIVPLRATRWLRSERDAPGGEMFWVFPPLGLEWDKNCGNGLKNLHVAIGARSPSDPLVAHRP